MGERTAIEHSKLNMASYGFGKFLTEFMEMAFTAWLFYFYVRTIGVDPLIIGLAVVVYAIWNAVNDPLVGYLTNKPFKFTRKWGAKVSMDNDWWCCVYIKLRACLYPSRCRSSIRSLDFFHLVYNLYSYI